MPGGIDFGLSQLSLATFTTFVPAGACAFSIIALFILLTKPERERYLRLERFLIIAVALILIGLIASTNHLGKPSNSLFILTGVGRSPLSNEVFSTVIFAGCAWLLWLVSFSSRFPAWINKALLVVGTLAAFAQIWFTAHAYSISTVATWSLDFTPLNQILAALVGGIAIALCILAAARIDVDKRFPFALIGCGIGVTLLAFAVQIAHYFALEDVWSSLVQASTIVSFYPLLSVLSAVGSVAAFTVMGLALKRDGTIGIARAIVALVIVLAAIFIVRFVFYCMYLPVGI